MRRALTYCAIAVMALGISLTAASALADDHEKTIKGEVIDQPCFENKNGARGEAHKGCALACAKRGNQLAIVDESNVVYSITGDYAANKNEKLIPFVAEMVEAKGVVTEKDGKKWIALASIKKLETK